MPIFLEKCGVLSSFYDIMTLGFLSSNLLFYKYIKYIKENETMIFLTDVLNLPDDVANLLYNIFGGNIFELFNANNRIFSEYNEINLLKNTIKYCKN